MSVTQQPKGPVGNNQIAFVEVSCFQDEGDPIGFGLIRIRGTAAIGDQFFVGRITPASGVQPVPTCAGVVAQASADATTARCTVGPTGSPDSPSQIAAHFVCTGGQDFVVGAIAAISRNFALATLPGSGD